MITVISVAKWGTTTLFDRRGHMNEIAPFLLTRTWRTSSRFCQGMKLNEVKHVNSCLFVEKKVKQSGKYVRTMTEAI